MQFIELLRVFLALTIAHAPATIITHLAVKEWGAEIEVNPIVRAIIKKGGYSMAVIVGHVIKLLVAWLICSAYDIAGSLWGSLCLTFSLTLFLINSGHDVMVYFGVE
ncbi:hypothetical protein JDFR1000234_45 [uncultured archaeal virus]|jgi:hypothetical protein|uniref:DUF5658 domain-containing protein n=1 Tax=uncultured archaeal virus TaxID=1960247 RepID=A0A1S5Y378_9VIRU|nr:hypothetical protein JDFR1000234_45 [uncultured archaeal virus]